MYNNDKPLQLYASKPLTHAILLWLDKQVHQIYTCNKKKINLSVLSSDLFSQPFLPKFLLKVNYDFFAKTQLIDFIDSTVLRKLSFKQKKLKFLSLIQKYLHYHERHKFVPIYKNFLYDIKNDVSRQKVTNEVIRLLLFIAIRSQNKNQFIDRIFKMPTQSQQSLMDQIMEVENVLQRITEKQQIALQFNFLKKQNAKLKTSYEELIDYQNKLIDRCENQDLYKRALQEKNQSNLNEKIYVCESLGSSDIKKPYLKIYKKLQDKNATLTRILGQKQKKQNELLQQFTVLKEKSDEFEEVLFELNQQKKKLKVILNDKKNQSFQLEMRASLRLSQETQNFRRSQALNHKSLANYKTALKNGKANQQSCSGRNNELATKSKQKQFSEINQSVNILAKIEELRSQKQSLKKELVQLQEENHTFKQKQNSNKQIFAQIQEIYAQVFALCPEYTAPKKQLSKQRSKTSLKTPSYRYF